MATKAKQTEVANLRSQVERYESFFTEIETFINFVRTEGDELKEAVAEEAKAKEAYTTAKNRVRELRESIEGSKDALYRLVEPGPAKFMPLFDRMDPADPEVHGEKSSEWRTDPITVLRLSPAAARSLMEVDIVAVGQLQDRVMADARAWHEEIDGITDAMAAAIVDKLNDFIFRDGDR